MKIYDDEDYLRQKIAENCTRIVGINEDILGARAALSKIKSEIEQKEAKKNYKTNLKKDLTTKKDNYKAVIPQLESVLSALEASETNLTNVATNLATLVSGDTTRMTTLIETVNERASVATEAIASLTGIQSQTKSTVEFLEGEISKLDTEITQLTTEIDSLKAQESSLNADIATWNDEISSLNAENEYLRSQL